MYRTLIILSWIKKRQTPIVAICAGAAIAAVLIIALVLVTGLKADIDEYEARLAVLGAEMEKYETAAQRNEVLTTDNDALKLLNGTLETENDDLAAANGELERQNGELLKKFDGLSRPS